MGTGFQRFETLSGFLTDGSFFETDLDTTFGGFFSDNHDGAGANATVTVTSVVPEPSTVAILSMAGALALVRRNRRF